MVGENPFKQRNLGIERDVVSCLYEIASNKKINDKKRLDIKYYVILTFFHVFLTFVFNISRIWKRKTNAWKKEMLT